MTNYRISFLIVFICLLVGPIRFARGDAPQNYGSAVDTNLANEFPSLGAVASNDAKAKVERSDSSTPTLTVGFALAIVLGLFGGLVWMSKKYGNGAASSGSIPKGVLESLGSTNLDPRTRVSLLRCGSRIVLIAQSSGGIQPLCEITDPAEVQSLISACNGDSATALADVMPDTTQMKPRQRRSRLFAAA